VPNGRLWVFSGYLIAASLLAWRIVTRFDRWLDRPDLSASN
jgi:hypothetical protein